MPCYRTFNDIHGMVQGYRSNCSGLRGSANYSAYCGGATKHGMSTANRFRPLKREQLPIALGFQRIGYG